jgi:mannose-6-phosphate isomerase-like protein (cupin superfamily)
MQRQRKEKIVVRHLNEVPVEDAHGGWGTRQLIFSNPDIPNSKLVAATIGFLPAKGRFKTHKHESVDEVMTIIKGRARIESGRQKFNVCPGYFVLFPSGVQHSIINTGCGKLTAQFVRFKR